MSRPSRLFPFRARVRPPGDGRYKGWRGGGRKLRKKRAFCGFTPEDTVSSGAIRDESRSSTRVPSFLSRWESVTMAYQRGCVCDQPDNPPLVAATFSYRIISFLNFVSFPYDAASSDTFVFVSPPSNYPPSFVSVSTNLVAAWLRPYDYYRYTPLTQLYFGPYDVSLTPPTPWRDAALPLRHHAGNHAAPSWWKLRRVRLRNREIYYL